METEMHLEREDVTVTGDFAENDATTEMIRDMSSTVASTVASTMASMASTASSTTAHSMSGMSAATMDASAGDHGEMTMKTFFHSGYGDVYLFKDWVITSANETVIACLALFLLAMLYEAVKTYQNQLLKKKYTHTNCYPVAASAADTTGCHESQPWARQMFSWYHLFSTVVHILQVTIGYCLMFAVMTFNIWLCLAVVLGAGLGFFLFSWKRRAPVTDNYVDNCYLNKSFVGDFNSTGFK